MLPKAWRRIEGDGVCLYKGGTSGASNTGREPYCEFYASQIAEAMGLPAVRYDLENWKGAAASKCRLFTDENASFVPVGRVVRSFTLQACLDYYDALGAEFGEQLRDMLMFDALIYNEDRHFGNFGLLRDNRSGEFIAPAPVFDNGMSLMSSAGRDDLESFERFEAFAATRTNPYRISFDRIGEAVTGRAQKARLRRLIGFRFRRVPSETMSDRHLDYLERLLKRRVRRFLSLPVRR